MKYRIPSILLALVATQAMYADSDAAAGDQKNSWVQYNNRMNVFSINYQAYERIKPDALYAKVSGYYVPELNHTSQALLDTEFRLGYNFLFNKKDHLTPFAGVGYLQDFHHHHHHTTHRPGIVYSSIGLLYDHEFNTIFNLGFGTRMLLGGAINQKDSNKWGNPVVAVEASLPITFRFGRLRHWDYRIEPFNLYVHGSSTAQNYVGFRNSFGYRF